MFVESGGSWSDSLVLRFRKWPLQRCRIECSQSISGMGRRRSSVCRSVCCSVCRNVCIIFLLHVTTELYKQNSSYIFNISVSRYHNMHKRALLFIWKNRAKPGLLSMSTWYGGNDGLSQEVVLDSDWLFPRIKLLF